MRKNTFLTYLFPIKGLHEGSAKWQQFPLTAYDLQNVRAYDPGTGRVRGGQRPGLTKYVGTQINGGNRVQDISHVTYASTVASSASAIAVRSIKAVAVAGGTMKTLTNSAVSAVTGGTSVLSSTVPVIFSTEFNGLIYFVDGTNYVKYTPGTNTAAVWTATLGTLPTDSSNTARLIEVWRGRVVLSGVKSDPQNWFMSAVGDALNFSYAPASESETQAVAGNNSPAGKIGDIINGMVPYSDDILIFGGDHTLWQMSGDPMSGGRIDLISSDTGMAWGRAWCKDPTGTIYFLSNRGGLYRLRPSLESRVPPERISAGRIDARLQRIIAQTYVARMAYDDVEQGVYLWITDLASATSTCRNYYYDIRQDAWYADRYGNNNHNPCAVHVYDGDDPNDRVVLIGGQDGYIRYLLQQAINDDGTAIDSFVYFGPIQVIPEDSQAAVPFILAELQAILSDNSSTVTYNVYAGNSPEHVFSVENSRAGFFLLETGDRFLLETGDFLLLESSSVQDTGTLSPVRSATVNPRARGYAAYVSLGTNGTSSRWAMESLQVKLAVIESSKRRRL